MKGNEWNLHIKKNCHSLKERMDAKKAALSLWTQIVVVRVVDVGIVVDVVDDVGVVVVVLLYSPSPPSCSLHLDHHEVQSDM